MLTIYLSMLDSDDERAKIADIYETHKPYMLRFAQKYIGNVDLSEDAVHDAFLSFIEHKEKYFSVSCREMRALLIIIVKNKCLDILRKANKYPIESFENMKTEIESPEMPINEKIVNAEGYANLRKYVATLDEASQFVLEMKYRLGMTYKEIGKELELTPKHVETKIMRAKAKVRKLVNEEGVGNG